jgi:RNA polymerase-binding transcription factor DksA
MSDHIDPALARQRLESERERVTGLVSSLRDEIGDTPESDQLGELASYDQHPADQGSETFEQELDQTTLAILAAEAKDVATAQQRLEEGTYGICIVGGEEIPAARLDAIPEALRCIEHQNIYDAELRARGGPLL